VRAPARAARPVRDAGVLGQESLDTDAAFGFVERVQGAE
jgi:hypothetical protein